MSIPEVWAKSPAIYERIQAIIGDGKFYEAQQMYMTQINRSAALGVREFKKMAGPTEGKLVDGILLPFYSPPSGTIRALKLILDAINTMFLPPTQPVDNVDSAFISSRVLAAKELSLLYISTLERVSARVTEESIVDLVNTINGINEKTLKLAELLNTKPEFTVLKDACLAIARTAIKWSSSNPVGVVDSEDLIPITSDNQPEPFYYRHGEPRFHQVAVDILGDAATPEIQHHWVRANNPEAHITSVLSSIRESDEESYVGVSAHIILDYLAIENVRGAFILYKGLSTRPIFEVDEAKNVMEFINIALLCVTKEGSKDVYERSLKAMKNDFTAIEAVFETNKFKLADVAQEVGSVYWELPPPVSMLDQVLQMASSMAGMFKR